MIGRIKGILLEKSPPWILVDVMGVGYQMQAPMNTFYHLKGIGETVCLHTHMVVREDAQLLYAFNDNQECAFFQELIKINGIGPKAALAMLSGLSIDELKQAIIAEEVGLLRKVPGIGPKTAQRIIVEMQDKKKNWRFDFNPRSETTLDKTAPIHQALQALVALGYKNKEAEQALDKLQDKSIACEDMIKFALQGLAKA